MKNLDLNNYGVQEMNAEGLKTVVGGQVIDSFTGIIYTGGDYILDPRDPYPHLPWFLQRTVTNY